MYDVFVADWLAVFPRDQVLVIKAEEYFNNRSNILKEIFHFLDVSPMNSDFVKDISESDIIHPRWKTSGNAQLPILGSTRNLLKAFFEPHNVNLATILNNDKYLWND